MALTTVAQVVYTTLFPIVLLAAGIIRINALSLVYFLAFITNVTWTPSVLLPARRALARTLSYAVTAVAALALLGHIIFHSVLLAAGDYGRSILPEDSTTTAWIAFIGFERVRDVGQGVRSILPDGVVFVVALFLLIMFRRKRVFVHTLDDLGRALASQQPLPRLHSIFCLLFVFIVGFSLPSILTVLYTATFVVLMLVKSLRHASLATMIRRAFAPLFFLVLFHMLSMWIYQVKWVSEWIPAHVSSILGYTSYTKFGPNMASLQHIVSWLSVIVLFVMLSVLNKNEATRRRTGKEVDFGGEIRAGLLDDQRVEQTRSFIRMSGRLRALIRRFGWAISVIGLLFSALLVPSMLGMFLLVFVVVASLAPQDWLERRRIIPGMMTYFVLSIVAQYVYNIPFGLPANQALASIGFSIWNELFWLKIGAQAAIFGVIAIFWDFSDSKVHDKPMQRPDSSLDAEQPPDSKPDISSASGLRNRKSKSQASLKPEDTSAPSETSETDEGSPVPARGILRRARDTFFDFFQSISLKQRRERVLSAAKAIGWFLVEQSYLLSLAFLYIAGLQAINLLNTGYMFVFVLFLVSAKLARKAWLLLIVYTEAIVLLVYTWHALSNWTSPSNNLIIYNSASFISDVVGLRVYASAWDLFSQGMLRHLAIMVFSVAQWQVNKLSEKRGHMPDQLPQWMRSVSLWFWHNWPYYGLFMVYLTLVVVVVVDSLSLSNVVYMVWFFVCMVIHLRSRSSIMHLRRIWIGIVVVAGVILISRYTYQFNGISSWITSVWPQGALLSPADFGLETFQAQGDSIFLRLLGNTVVLLVVVVQMRAFFPGKRAPQADQATFELPTTVLELLNFTQRLAMLHIMKLVIIVLFVLSLAPLSGLNAVYVVFVLWSFATTDGSDAMGLPILLYTAVVTHAQLLYQFPRLQSLYPADIMRWVGLFPASAGRGRWELIQGYLWLAILLVLQRYAARAKRDWYRERLQLEGAPKRLTLFLYANEFVVEKEFSTEQLSNGIKWYLSNLLSINAYRAFIGCMLLLVFVRHQFILAPFWLLVLGISIITRVKWWRRRSVPLRLVLIFLALEIMLQYVFNLDLPPGWNSPWKTWQPPLDWKGAPEWFGISLQNKYVLVADWFAMFVISRILSVERQELRHTSYWKNIVESIATYEDFQKPRSWYNSVRFYIFRFSLFWILLFIFAAGSVQPDVVSFGYIVFALWFLFRESELYRRRNRLWRWARLFNYLLLLVRVVYQAPFIPPSSNDPSGFSQIIGLRKVDEIKDLAFDIVIFVLLSAQKLLFERKEFDLVVRYILDEEDKGIRVAHQRFQEWKKERRKQLEKVGEEKKRRKQQLELLKAARHHQQKLWMQLKPESTQSKMATLMPGASVPTAFELDPRMQTLSTTEDLKRLQEMGALDIEQDDVSKEITMRFARHFSLPNQHPISDSVAETDIIVAESDDQIVIQNAEDSPEPETEPAEIASPSSAVPVKILVAADMLISFLDKFIYMDLNALAASRPKKIAVGLYKIYQRYSHLLCYTAFLINAVYNANVVSAFFPLSMFMYALLEIPRPHRLYWNIVFVYTSGILLIKFMFQISAFCTCNGPTGDTWSFYPYCPGTPGAGCDFERTSKGTLSFTPSYPNIIGIRKFDGLPFVIATLPDVIVLMAVWMHRHWLKKQGYWAFVKRYVFAADDESMKRQVLDETRHYEKILLRQALKRERWGEMEAQHRLQRLQKARRWVTKGKANSDLKSWLIREQDELREEVVENPIFGNPLADIHPESEEAEFSRVAVQGSMLAGVGEAAPSPSPTPLIQRDARLTPELALPSYLSRQRKEKERDDESDSLSGSKKERRKSRLLITTPKARRELEEQEQEAKIRKKKEKHKLKRKKKESQPRPERRSPGDGADSLPADMSASSDLSAVSLAASLATPMLATAVMSEFTEEPSQAAFRDAALDISADLQEEEDEGERSFLLHKLRSFGNELRVFYTNLIDQKAGKDLYVVLWFTELLCFFWIMFLPTDFIGGTATNIAQFFSSGRSIPMSYVLTLLTQFLLIVTDRTIYLFRAVRVKVVFQYIQVLFLHFWLWFYLPSQNGDYFVRFPSLIAFYLLKFVYLFVSGLQIAYGYPQFVQGQFLTDSKSPSQLRYYAFVAYRAIPFVYELRTLLDWTVTKTTLSFYEWLKLEDVYAQLFLVKCRVTSDKNWERNVGDKQPWYMKLALGALLFGALILVIWFPLLALMQGSPGSSLNPIVAADVKIAFQAYGSAIYISLAQNISSEVPMDTFNQIRLRNQWISPEDQKLLQIIPFTEFSDELWTISPPARDALESALLRNDTIYMYAYLTFTRQKPIQNSATMTYQTMGREIPNEFKPQIAAALAGQTGANFTVLNLLPRFYRVPIVPPIQIPQPQDPFSVTLSLRRKLSTDSLSGFNETRIDEFWKASQNSVASDPFYDTIFPPGLYVGIVLAVGRFLRLSITDLSYRIVFEDMPECDELLSYCEDIFLARQDGDLKLEEDLFRELIELYRSPERIILRTMPKGPRFKGRQPKPSTDKSKAE